MRRDRSSDHSIRGAPEPSAADHHDVDAAGPRYATKRFANDALDTVAVDRSRQGLARNRQTESGCSRYRLFRARAPGRDAEPGVGPALGALEDAPELCAAKQPPGAGKACVGWRRPSPQRLLPDRQSLCQALGCQAQPALGTACLQDLAAVSGRAASPKAVCPRALQPAGVKSLFHSGFPVEIRGYAGTWSRIAAPRAKTAQDSPLGMLLQRPYAGSLIGRLWITPTRVDKLRAGGSVAGDRQSLWVRTGGSADAECNYRSPHRQTGGQSHDE